MTNYKRSDVILVLYSNSDLQTYKKRPALTVQADGVNTELCQRVVALIAFNLNRTGLTRVTISKNSSAYGASGFSFEEGIRVISV